MAVRNDEGVRNEEAARAAIYTCLPPVHGWAAVWPRIRRLAN
jgi:hypothetical protein